MIFWELLPKSTECKPAAGQNFEILWLLGKPIDEQVNSALTELHQCRRRCLLEQLKNLRYLARQGIPRRNHIDEEGNLKQLLKLSSLPGMKQYLADGHYQSHHINTELTKEMYRSVITKILDQIRDARFYAIVIDETRDISGKFPTFQGAVTGSTVQCSIYYTRYI